MKNNRLYFLKNLNDLKKNSILELMNINFTFISHDLKVLKVEMNIKTNLLQPFGYLHGGVSTILAETAGSSLSYIKIMHKKFYKVFNIETSINHIKKIKTGCLIARAQIVNIGKLIHVINVDITNEKKILIGFCKMTNLIKKNKDVK